MSSARPDFNRFAAMSDSEYMAWHLPRTYHRSLGHIAIEADCGIDDLPAIVANTATYLLDQTAQSNFEDSSTRREIDQLYSVRYALNDEGMPVTPGLSTLGQSLASFESFIQTYAPERQPNELRNLISRVHRFTSLDIGEPRIRWLLNGRNPAGRLNYLGQGEWRCVERDDYSRLFVEQTVVDEVLQQSNAPTRARQVFHATGSAALEGIAEQQALLGARTAIARGVPIRSGEYVTGVMSSDSRGLSQIYAESGVSSSYTTVRWFDEYPVIFGIDAARLKRWADGVGRHLDLTGGWGEGMQLGPEVPLSTVATLYTHRLRVPQLEAWRASHCPEASVASLEAAKEGKTIRLAHERGALGDTVTIA